MKKIYSLLMPALLLMFGTTTAQTTYTSAISDITLQCSGGTANRTGVAYNPCLNLYYSVNAGSGSYPIETFGPNGGSSLSSTSQTSDYRGLWWNNVNNRLEGNTYNSGGVYSNTLNTNGYATSTTTFVSSSTMPNAQSMGMAGIANNIIYYYNSGTVYRYNKTSNALISSNAISGLPVATSNLNSYGIIYTGFPGADVGVYDYINRAIYFLNSTTSAYTASCSLPTSAPNPSTFRMGFANNRFFLYDSGTSQWLGYPISNGPSGPSPTASVVASSASVCSGYSVTLTASGATSYTWSFGGNSSSAVVNPTANTIYSVTATGSTGCTGVNTVAVNIIAGANVSIAASPTAICTGGGATLTSGGGVNSYTWNSGSNATLITVGPSSTTSYTVQGTNSQGCISNAVITLTVNGTAPVLSVVSSTNQTCLGKTATLTASGALTYSWSNGVQNGVSFNPSVTTTYTVTGQNGCGTGSAVTTITVAPIPITIVSSPSIICAGDPALITASSAGTSYTWFPINTATNYVNVSPTVTSVYTVATSDGTCSGVGTITLVANPIPTVSSNASSSVICVADVLTLTATGGLSYTWTPGNLVAQTVTVSPSAPTLYSVVASNSIGCLAGSSQIVLVDPTPTVSLLATDPLICVGGSSSITATGNGNTYNWSSGGIGTSITVNPVLTTIYTCTVSNNANLCTSTETIEIGVFDPVLTIIGNTVICDGNTTTLTANGATTYTWLPNTPFQSINVTPNVTTIYSVSAISQSANINCPSNSTVQVVVNPNPTITTVSSRTVICKNESATISASGANTYSWSTSASGPSVTVTSSLVTNLNIVVTGSNTQGCTSSATVTIKVNGCNGLADNETKSDILVYPNPNNGAFVIQSNTAMELMIVNELGQTVSNLSLNENNQFSISVPALASGIYFLRSADGAGFAKKIVVEK
ncbi:MAG: T9SS type A sorting domain-containing protein [Bacteroidia bacterium]|nr:T9SS type A sorting domain-containing protein [Bacteroidia bacterium]